MKKLLACLFVTFSTLLPVSLLQAGGIHYQISTSTRFFANEAGQLEGFLMNWVYDPEISSVILEGLEMDAASLQQLGKDMMADLFELGYFVQFSANSRPITVNEVSEFNIQLVDNNSIQLGMQVDLRESVPLAGNSFQLTLADFDGSALLAYAGVDRIALSPEMTGKCSAPQLTSRKTDLNGHNMDVQTVTIRCQ
ncbi:MAG: DUF1007 family protein [Thiolinea sp.]